MAATFMKGFVLGANSVVVLVVADTATLFFSFLPIYSCCIFSRRTIWSNLRRPAFCGEVKDI